MNSSVEFSIVVLGRREEKIDGSQSRMISNRAKARDGARTAEKVAINFEAASCELEI